MKYDLRSLGAVGLVAAFAVCGCSRPAQNQAEESGQAAGMKSGCVGLGCDEKVSAGLQEKCVGMGCPADQAQ